MSAIILGRNQYGKAENRVVRVYRDVARHEIHDVNVSSCLRGDFSDAHLTGDQAKVLTTDAQKQTAYAFGIAQRTVMSDDALSDEELAYLRELLRNAGEKK